MNKMIEQIKEINKGAVCLYKVGNFYHAYSRDSVILSYLFDYKIKELGEKDKECGFPIGALGKITAKFQDLKINYLLIDRRNNYDVDEKEDYKKANNYEDIYEKAIKYVNRRKRIDNISQYLKENIEKDNISKKIAQMEEIMYEN